MYTYKNTPLIWFIPWSVGGESESSCWLIFICKCMKYKSIQFRVVVWPIYSQTMSSIYKIVFFSRYLEWRMCCFVAESKGCVDIFYLFSVDSLCLEVVLKENEYDEYYLFLALSVCSFFFMYFHFWDDTFGWET